MSDRNAAGDKKTLKGFLIGRFFAVMFVIFACEQMIGMLYSNILIPGITLFLERQRVSIRADNNPTAFALQMLLYFLASFLPGGMDGYMQRFIAARMGSSLWIAVDSPLFSGGEGVIMRVLIVLMFLVLIVVSALPYLAGAFYYYIVVTKRVNKMIEAEKEQQLAYDRQRNLLLSDIAHDIRTPITTLCAYSKALSDGMVQGDKKQEYLDAIYTRSMRMSELITLLFEYVKMDSSGFTLHREKGDLGELLRECIAGMYSDFEERRIALRVEIPETPSCYRMDSVQMSRAVTNLLTNAVRYGREGGRVLVKLDEYTVTVADDGMEIDREFAAHIFDPFSRADKARSTKGGSGLGLSIAFKIVEMHGGELKLDCDYGRGYTKAFRIVLREEDD